MKQLIKQTRNALILSIIVFLLIELTARVVNPNGISYYPDTARFMNTMILEEPIGYRNAPGTSDDFYGHPVSINSIGLRDDEISQEPAQDEYRILMMGDSVVFGVGVAAHSTISSQLEALVNANSTAQPVETVTNMGVVSYNTEQEMIQYQQLGSTLNPDLVVLFYSLNDIEPKMWIFDKRANALTRIAERSYAVVMIYSIIQMAKDKLNPQNSRINLSAYRESSSAWQRVKQSLATLADNVTSDGAGFVLVTSGKGDHITLLRSVAEEYGFPFCVMNLFNDPRYQHIEPASLFAKGGGLHFNHEGLAIQTQAIYESLLETNVLPGNTDTQTYPNYCRQN
jgi:hypothetical protein